MALSPEKSVLVVDDEELMREVVVMMIEEEGGAALSAVDGHEAVELVRARGGDISCVLMDFSMPRMNGYEAYLAIREIAPALPVIITSGLKISPEVQSLVDGGAVQFLSKPFHQHDVVAAVERALNGAPSA